MENNRPKKKVRIPKEVRAAVHVASKEGNSQGHIGTSLGISKCSVNRILHENTDEYAYEIELEKKKSRRQWADMRNLGQRAILRTLKGVEETETKPALNQLGVLITMCGVSQDKELLLSGEATTRSESLTTLTVEEKREKLAEYEREYLRLHQPQAG